jgi:hypothetical protein
MVTLLVNLVNVTLVKVEASIGDRVHLIAQ